MLTVKEAAHCTCGWLWPVAWHHHAAQISDPPQGRFWASRLLLGLPLDPASAPAYAPQPTCHKRPPPGHVRFVTPVPLRGDTADVVLI